MRLSLSLRATRFVLLEARMPNTKLVECAGGGTTPSQKKGVPGSRAASNERPRSKAMEGTLTRPRDYSGFSTSARSSTPVFRSREVGRSTRVRRVSISGPLPRGSLRREERTAISRGCRPRDRRPSRRPAPLPRTPKRRERKCLSVACARPPGPSAAAIQSPIEPEGPRLRPLGARARALVRGHAPLSRIPRP